jgi:hypothetical protein
MAAPWRIAVADFDNRHGQFLKDGSAMLFYGG